MIITFSGPDGSGKTSIIKNIKEALEGQGQNYVHKHHRPMILPNLGYFLGRGARDLPNSDGIYSPHSGDETTMVSSFLRLSYYWLDYFLGLRLKLVKQSIVYDRYYFDFFIDGERSKVSHFSNFYHRLFSIIPSDLNFLILASPHQMVSRKGELSLEKAEELRLRYLTYWEMSNPKKFIVIDNSKDIESSIKTVLQAIANVS